MSVTSINKEITVLNYIKLTIEYMICVAMELFFGKYTHWNLILWFLFGHVIGIKRLLVHVYYVPCLLQNG